MKSSADALGIRFADLERRIFKGECNSMCLGKTGLIRPYLHVAISLWLNYITVTLIQIIISFYMQITII